MGTLVHTCLGSSYLIAHVLHCPPPPPAHSFIIGPVVINTPRQPGIGPFRVSSPRSIVTVWRRRGGTRGGSAPTVDNNFLPTPKTSSADVAECRSDGVGLSPLRHSHLTLMMYMSSPKPPFYFNYYGARSRTKIYVEKQTLTPHTDDVYVENSLQYLN
jgi:hypothetical protein